ncbi:hypothetical protein FRC08_006366 [Ceratobasidium sp. 394]|nr:hypothetical protein FRC08_006366 [Ceratobasidium sp. 394]
MASANKKRVKRHKSEAAAGPNTAAVAPSYCKVVEPTADKAEVKKISKDGKQKCSSKGRQKPEEK